MTTGPQLPPTPAVGSATTAPPTVHGATPAERVEVLRLPDALLARLIDSARPLILSGTVQSVRPDGTVPLRTQFGEIVLNSGKTLAANRPISLHIPPPTGNPAAQLSQRGLPAFLLTAPTITGAPAAAPASAGTPAMQPTAPAPAPVPAGPASAGAAPAPAGAAPPATGAAPMTTGTLANLAAQMLAQRGVPAPQAGPPSPPPAGSPTPTAAGPTAPGTASRPTGTAGGTAASGPSATPAGPIAGQMPGSAGTDRLAGNASSRPPAGIPGQRPAAVGPLPAPAGPVAAGPVAAEGETGTRMLRGLTETLQVLAQSNDALAGQVLRALVPQPGSRLTATLLLFLFAVRGGDSRGWMGDRASATLDAAGRGDLLTRLSADFAAMGRGEATAGASGEARPITIPFLFGGELHGLRFSVLPDGEQDDPAGRRRRRGKRFQIDLELSRLGPVQLEGTMTVKRFDLALRTYRSLPREARAEAVQVFETACEASGLVGGLTFQSGPHLWADMIHRGHPGLRASVSA